MGVPVDSPKPVWICGTLVRLVCVAMAADMAVQGPLGEAYRKNGLVQVIFLGVTLGVIWYLVPTGKKHGRFVGILMETLRDFLVVAAALVAIDVDGRDGGVFGVMAKARELVERHSLWGWLLALAVIVAVVWFLSEAEETLENA